MLLCAGVNDFEFLRPPEGIFLLEFWVGILFVGSKVGERVWLDAPGFKFEKDDHLKAIN